MRDNFAAAEGGGIEGGLVFVRPSEFGGDISFVDSVVEENVAGNGGGISVWASSLALTGSSIRANRGTAGFGAGILTYATTMTMSGGAISDNFGVVNGSALLNGARATLTDVTISGNQATGGIGAVDNFGRLTLVDSHVAGNIAGAGAAIGNLSFNTLGEGAGLFLENTVVSGNTATTGGGGGIRNWGPATLTNSTIENNTAAGAGGGILADLNSTATPAFGVITINGGAVRNNTANGNWFEHGGGGGIATLPFATVNLDGVDVAGNRAPNFGDGGGIFNRGVVRVTGGSIHNNEALSGGGIGNGSGAFTGGLVELTNTTVGENFAPGLGGGVTSFGGTIQMDGATVDRNHAFASGGGVYVQGATLNANGGQITGNIGDEGGGIASVGSTATVTGTTFGGSVPSAGNVASGAGGGVLVSGGAGTFTMTGGVFQHNRSNGPWQSSGGGAGLANGSGFTAAANVVLNGVDFLDNDSPLGDGGAVYNEVGGSLEIDGGEFRRNHARSGGAIANGAGSDASRDGGTLTVRNALLSENRAHTFGGGIANRRALATVVGSTISENELTEFGRGAGVYSQSPGTLRLEDSHVDRNRGVDGGGVAVDDAAVIEGGSIDGNTARTSGGGLWMIAPADVDVEGTSISGNTVEAGNGGGIASGRNTFPDPLPGGKLVLRNATVNDNVVTPLAPAVAPAAGGGGISAIGGSTELIGTTVDGNVVENPATFLFALGGGIMGGGFTGLPTQISVTGNSRISNNLVRYSTSSGGGISAGSSLTVEDSSFTGNEATEGGAIFTAAGTVNVTGSRLEGNTAGRGGGIATLLSSTVLDDTVVAANQATEARFAGSSGGGIYNQGGTMAVRNGSEIVGNTAEGLGVGGGGGIVNQKANDTATLSVTNSTVEGNRAPNGTGGGIRNESVASVTDSVVRGNSARGGAGITNFSTAAGSIGSLGLIRSTVEGNEATGLAGGGIVNDARSLLFVVTSTLSGNTAVTGGGGLQNAGNASLTNSTVSGNRATDPAATGGGIANSGGILLRTTTITGNNAPSGGGGLLNSGSAELSRTIVAGNGADTAAKDCTGPATSLGFNLVGAGTGCPSGGIGDVTFALMRPISELLAPLADNGGATFTHALVAGSPALDAAGLGCPGGDQRGLPRPKDGDGDGVERCDIGAFEQQTPLELLKLNKLTPEQGPANGGAFPLAIEGVGFEAGSVVHWNGSPRATFVQTPTLITATIPASDVAIAADLATAVVTVINPDGTVSNPLPFTITSGKVAQAESKVAVPGQTATASSGTTAPAVSATLTNNTPGTGTATVTAARYGSLPTPTTIFAAGGFVDLQVGGADPTDSVAARMYYPETVVGATEAGLQLLYWTGTVWAPVESSGGAAPAKDTTDNLDGVVSGGRFGVTFDNTSTPKVTELGGTVFALTGDQVGRVTSIAPSCNAFRDGAAGELGALEYTLRSGNLVAGVSPSQFRYWTRVRAPAGSFAVEVRQSGAFRRLALLGSSNVRVHDETCHEVPAAITVSGDQARIEIAGAAPDMLYLISARYSTQPLLGKGAPGGGTAHYDFETLVGGVLADRDPNGIALQPKPATAEAAALRGGQAFAIPRGAKAAARRPARGMLLRPCGRVTVVGKRWAVLTNAVSCAQGLSAVRRLAVRRVPARRAPYPGTYAGGLSCVGGPSAGAKPKSIVCGRKGTHKAVTAFRDGGRR